MSSKKRKYSAKFKFDRVLETIKGIPQVEVSRQYNINSNLISKWRNNFLTHGYEIFETNTNKEITSLRSKVSKLEQIIGKKEIELNLIKNFADFYQSQNGM